jgi:hypothetical protein
MRSASAASRRRPPGSPFKPPVVEPLPVFAVDDRVTHDKCGLGRVVAVEEDIAVLVAFGDQELRIVAPYAKLTKL